MTPPGPMSSSLRSRAGGGSEVTARATSGAPAAAATSRAPRAIWGRAPTAPGALLAPAQLVEHLVAPLVRAQCPIAHRGHAQVRVGLRLAALEEAAGVEHLDDGEVLRGEPQVGHLAPVHVGAAVLHRAEAPRLDALRERAVRPRVRDGDPRALLAPERHALAE